MAKPHDNKPHDGNENENGNEVRPPKPDSVILFLDIDGVLNTSSTYRVWRDAGGDLEDLARRHFRLDLLFEPRCIEAVNETMARIQTESGREVQIVISSSWREEHSLGELRDLLASVGLHDAHRRIIDRTPSGSWEIRWRGQPPLEAKHKLSRPAYERGAEIADWLNKAGIWTLEELDQRVLILEDEAPVYPFKRRQVKTTFHAAGSDGGGFGPRHVKAALRLFGLKTDP